MGPALLQQPAGAANGLHLSTPPSMCGGLRWLRPEARMRAAQQGKCKLTGAFRAHLGMCQTPGAVRQTKSTQLGKQWHKYCRAPSNCVQILLLAAGLASKEAAPAEPAT